MEVTRIMQTGTVNLHSRCSKLSTVLNFVRFGLDNALQYHCNDVQ